MWLEFHDVAALSEFEVDAIELKRAEADRIGSRRGESHRNIAMQLQTNFKPYPLKCFFSDELFPYIFLDQCS